MEYGKNLGLTREETRKALFLQRPELESLWVENGGSGGLGYQLLEAGRYLEYECYDDQQKGQGRAIILLEKWEDREIGLFLGRHLRAGTQGKSSKRGSAFTTCVTGGWPCVLSPSPGVIGGK